MLSTIGPQMLQPQSNYNSTFFSIRDFYFLVHKVRASWYNEFDRCSVRTDGRYSRDIRESCFIYGDCNYWCVLTRIHHSSNHLLGGNKKITINNGQRCNGSINHCLWNWFQVHVFTVWLPKDWQNLSHLSVIFFIKSSMEGLIKFVPLIRILFY